MGCMILHTCTTQSVQLTCSGAACRWFSLYHGVWNIALDVWFLAANMLPLFWGLASQLVARYGFDTAAEIQTSVVFCLMFGAIPMLLDIPWSLYSTFVIEERHGFNKQTPSLFLKDFAKSVGPALLLHVQQVHLIAHCRLAMQSTVLIVYMACRCCSLC
jgi:CAAX prenyl protease N-terminal, five membrane helices